MSPSYAGTVAGNMGKLGAARGGYWACMCSILAVVERPLVLCQKLRIYVQLRTQVSFLVPV